LSGVTASRAASIALGCPQIHSWRRYRTPSCRTRVAASEELCVIPEVGLVLQINGAAPGSLRATVVVNGIG
jgi:hypothetical protein